MDDRIKTEINKANHKYYFKLKDKENDILEISEENVLLAEAFYQIRFRKYHKDINLDEMETVPEAKPKEWSTKTCFLAMKKWPDEFEKLLGFACIAINAENSTHLKKKERKAIVKVIVEKQKTLDEFKNALTCKGYPIIQEIRGLKDTSKGIRDNYSFATKLCHFACFYLFDGDARDIYSIYDSVLIDSLKKLGCKGNYKDPQKGYKNYQNAIGEIIKGKGISRNGFDHLMWVYYS